MARNRMIKSEFWTSEQILACSPEARLLFIGLWSFADDNGIYPGSYIKLKAQVFPNDFTIEIIKAWITELICNELLFEYIVENKTYWMVTGWKKHQRIDKPTYRYPLPSSQLKKIDNINQVVEEYLDSSLKIVDEFSDSPRRVIEEESNTDSLMVATKEKEKKKEKKNNIREIESLDLERSDSGLNQIFQYWRIIMNHPRAKFDRKRQSVIRKALDLGYSIDEMKQAIDGCANTPYNMGKNSSGQIYDDISLILRDAEHIERFINNLTRVNEHKVIDYANDVMAGVI